ncbi:MAG TPA: sigma-70 family RNA polymerase sigma factor [Polyangiaceae bacterium]
MAAGTLERNPFAPVELKDADRASETIERVYAEHFRYVWRCLRALGVKDAVLDDAVHDVFLVVQQKLASFDGQVAITTWLYAIALRVARRARASARKDAWRYAPVDEGVTERPAALPAEGNLEQALEQGERLSLARRALDRLDDDKREVFVLSQVEDRSAPEIADITGVPLNTVYSRIRAAKAAFHAEVTRLELVTRGTSR